VRILYKHISYRVDDGVLAFLNFAIYSFVLIFVFDSLFIPLYFL
jgi:hypothetical protein